VNEDRTLEKRISLPALSSENYKNGYPFFMGSVTIDGEYDYDGNGGRDLSLQGRFIVAQLVINGVKTDMTMDIRKDITQYLKVGKNTIQIILKSSLRNLFGPHHFAPDAEPMGVSPGNFTMRGTWGDGDSPIYTHVYNSVPFGVDTIEMICY
jgi:ribosomal protein S24E